MEVVKSAPRKLYIDFIKIIAIYMVLFNHTGNRGFVLFTVARSSLLYPLYLLLAIFIKIAVPLFFMCTGALLLGKEESYRDLLMKRFLKYAILLLVASAIIYIYIYKWPVVHIPERLFEKGLYWTDNGTIMVSIYLFGLYFNVANITQTGKSNDWQRISMDVCHGGLD